MKIFKLCFIGFIFVFAASTVFATETVTQTTTETTTQTVTPTTTQTATQTVTETATPDWTPTGTFTITPTATITPTFTSTPTPQPKFFAYPNPAYTNEITIAYPLDDAKTPLRATIIINAVNGEEAGRIYDDTPNGYTRFDITALARGVYFYRLIIKYTDNSETVHKYKKFSVVK
ncbi:MAG: hypothetical protein ACLFP1_00205 [Candidatus Goldiibacteriota bacterium]